MSHHRIDVVKGSREIWKIHGSTKEHLAPNNMKKAIWVSIIRVLCEILFMMSLQMLVKLIKDSLKTRK